MPKPKPSTIPINWPTHLPYLSQPIIAPNLPKDILTQALASPTLEKACITITNPTTPYSNIRITSVTEHSHPAYGQCGLFTTRVHEPDSFVCLYLGLVHGTFPTPPAASLQDDDGSDAKSDYDLCLDRELGLAIDAATLGNEARFINDYRGIIDRPNADFRDVIVKGKGGKKERGVGVFVKAAKKDKKGKVRKEDKEGIKKGEEVLVSYGRGFWSARTVESKHDLNGSVHGSPKALELSKCDRENDRNRLRCFKSL